MQVAFQQLAMGDMWATIGAFIGMAGAFLIILKHGKEGFKGETRDIAIKTALLGVIAYIFSKLGAVAGIVGNLLSLASLGLLGALAGYAVVLVLTPVFQAAQELTKTK